MKPTPFSNKNITKPAPIKAQGKQRWYQHPNLRSWVLQGFAVTGLTVGLVKAAHLQLWTPEAIQNKGAGRYEKELVLPAQRGKLLDRNNHELANNITTAAVSLVGSQAKLNSSQTQNLLEY